MDILVTGASGYIGGRLVPRLLAQGHRVRCMVRDPAKLRDVPWGDQVEVVAGDVLDEQSLQRACAGIEVLYYLVHSLSSENFAAIDRRAALLTAQAAREAGIGRIVYLGGLHPREEQLSDHLGSRAEVGEIFLRSGVPTAVLQAAVVIGSGSASFEMLRYLTERLPVMVTPSWVRNRVQPIAIRDVLHYLTAAATLPGDVNRSFDIGGPEVMTYEQMMRRYATVVGLPRRRMLSVSVLSPRLSSHWINIVTPVPKSVGAPLIDSLVHEAICLDRDVHDYLPPPGEGPITYERAVQLALAKSSNGEVDTRWSDASPTDAPADPLPSDPDWAGGLPYFDTRRRYSTASPAALWEVIEGIGGKRGWYSFPLAWSVRGLVDRLSGGVGLRRGRRDPDQLRTGDALDWWRVERLEEGRLLRLRAEMKLPGRAWLELSVEQAEGGGTMFHQRAIFLPSGLLGPLYWWAISPFHGVVFGSMAENIARTAENHSSGAPPVGDDRNGAGEERLDAAG